ncbi:MAG: hypothetical protein Q8O07_08175 [Chloroflexota bacterium]|nr:hypothetical protein [Chloroflexota bacterium]
MTRVVESVAEEYGQSLSWEKVVIKQREGARRFRELSQSLGRPAPVPSIFVEGQLVFDITPGQEELQAYLDRRILGDV